MTPTDAAIIAAYDAAVAAGDVRVGEARRGVAATLSAALALGLTSSAPVLDALRRARHADTTAWDEARRAAAPASAGRPRKPGERTASGRLSRAASARRAVAVALADAADERELERQDRAAPRPAELARMRELLRARVMDQRDANAWLTPAGADFLAGRIDAETFHASSRIHDARVRHLHALGVRTARSADLQPTHATPLDPETVAGQIEADAQRAARGDWEAIAADLDAAIVGLAAQARTHRAIYIVRSEWMSALLRYCCAEGPASRDDAARACEILGALTRKRRAARSRATR